MSWLKCTYLSSKSSISYIIQMTVLKNVVENRDSKMRDMLVAHVLDYMFALIVLLITWQGPTPMCQIGPGTTSALEKKQPIMSDLRGSRTSFSVLIEFPFFWHGSLKLWGSFARSGFARLFGGVALSRRRMVARGVRPACIGWNDNQGSQIPGLTTLARFNQGLRY